MKTLIITLAILILGFRDLPAQEQISLPRQSRGLAIGVGAGHYHYDGGFNISITTPYLFNRNVAMRVAAASRWLEIYDLKEGVYLNRKYASIQSGIVVATNTLGEKQIRGYAEAGPYMIFQNEYVSDPPVLFGGYGTIGIEFFIIRKANLCTSYYFEEGFMASQSTGSEKSSRLRHSNGLLATTGFRFYFR